MPSPHLPKPYFIPAGVDWNALPAALQAAMHEIIVPAYRALVICAESALERSAGTTLVFLMALEVLEQDAVLRERLAAAPRPSEASRSAGFDRLLKIVRQKQAAEQFLLDFKLARIRHGSLVFLPTEPATDE